MFNINFADDWIQTVDLRYQKQLLYQLSHDHCPPQRDVSILNYVCKSTIRLLTPLQKLPKNVVDLGKLIVAKDFKNLPKFQ